MFKDDEEFLKYLQKRLDSMLELQDLFKRNNPSLEINSVEETHE